MSEFHFIRPLFLLGIVCALWLGWRMRQGQASDTIDQLVDAHLQAAVVDRPTQGRHYGGAYWLTLGLVLLSLSLAGPAWERLPQPLYQSQQGRVIVLSLSNSMDRSDMQPSRLQRARFKVDDLLVSLPGVLSGLVGFAGEAFIVAPLSDDNDTIANLLQALDSQTLPVQGHRAERGLRKAAELLQQVAIDAGEIILVTDQASPLAVRVAAELAKKSFRVSVLEVAPAADASQSALLQSIARSGAGVYTRLTANADDLRRLNAPLLQWARRTQSEKSQGRQTADQWRDQGPWLLIPVLLLGSMLFRRGGFLGVAPLVLLMGLGATPLPVQAVEWPSFVSPSHWLWQRDDQRQLKAVEAYRAKDFVAAQAGFEQDDSAVGAYNRGNVATQNGQLESALAAYDEALKLRPDFEDATYNRALVEQALKKQQAEQEEQKKQDSSEGSEGEQSEEGQNGEQNNEPSEEQGGEQGEEQQNQGEESDSGERDDADSASEEAQQTEAEKDASSQDHTTEEKEAQVDESVEEESGEESEQASAALSEERAELQDENEQALQLMLRQVPDNPGALLQRKFKYQYQKQRQQP